MQETSALYRRLLAEGAGVERRLAIGESGALITKAGDAITFGGVRILVASSGADGGYDESIVSEISTQGQVFPDGGPSIGGTQAGEIDVDMFAPAGEIPRQARLAPYIRLAKDGEYSEWLPQGVYFVDTREDKDPAGLRRLRLHGYDAMLRAEQDYPSSRLSWPALDTAVVREIAQAMDVGVDNRVWQVMTAGYRIPYPTEYSCREILGYIGAMYAGNWIMSDAGNLLLVPLGGLPKETRLLVDSTRSTITFGGVRILV